VSEKASRYSLGKDKRDIDFQFQDKEVSLRLKRKRVMAEEYSAPKDVYPVPDYDDINSLSRQMLR
jgi:hypothetical protein